MIGAHGAGAVNAARIVFFLRGQLYREISGAMPCRCSHMVDRVTRDSADGRRDNLCPRLSTKDC